MIGLDRHESNSSDVSSRVARLRFSIRLKGEVGSLALMGQILYIKKLNWGCVAQTLVCVGVKGH